MINGCYRKALQPVKGAKVVSWTADGGSYYGRADGDLNFAEGEMTLSEMADAVDC